MKEYEKKPKEEEEDLRKMENPPRKIEGIGPTTKDGIPVALRSVSYILSTILVDFRLLYYLFTIKRKLLIIIE